MRNILSILALTFIISVIVASASEFSITSPESDKKYYVWDEIPVIYGDEGVHDYSTYAKLLPDGTETLVDGDVLKPDIGGEYLITVRCDDCDDEDSVTINVRDSPRPTNTRIVIKSPDKYTNYIVGEPVPIIFESLLPTIRPDVKITSYVTAPNSRERIETDTWVPTVANEYYVIEVKAEVDGFTFIASNGFKAAAS